MAITMPQAWILPILPDPAPINTEYIGLSQTQHVTPLIALTIEELRNGLERLPQELKDKIEEHTITYAGEYRHLTPDWKPPAMFFLTKKIRRDYSNDYLSSKQPWSLSADMSFGMRDRWITRQTRGARSVMQTQTMVEAGDVLRSINVSGGYVVTERMVQTAGYTAFRLILKRVSDGEFEGSLELFI